jgi:hypothetical protein
VSAGATFLRRASPVKRIAHELLTALDDHQKIEPPSQREQEFDVDLAYLIAAEIRRIREARGERVLGRKIGFTNRAIWPEYGVYAPIWGYVYETTVHSLPAPIAFDLNSVVEPRIEPEIVFGLSRAPQPDMDERALLSCIEWVAHGFEIVSPCFRVGDLRQRTPLPPSDCTGRCSLGLDTPLRLLKAASGSMPYPRFTSRCSGTALTWSKGQARMSSMGRFRRCATLWTCLSMTQAIRT